MPNAPTGRTWNLHAHASRGTYWHIGTERWVKLHGLTDPVVPVLLEEWLGDPRDPEVTHYGWEYNAKPGSGEYNAKPGSVTMIYPRAKGERPDLLPWLSLNMCFAYGMQAEIDAGKGKMVALRITAA